MADVEPTKKAKRIYTKHGFSASKKIVSVSGYKAVDGRSALALELKAERAGLIAALGGPAEISSQEMSIIEMICMKRIRRKPIQEWALLNRDALFNRRNKCLAPIALQLEQLEESEVRLLKELGLKRKPKQVSLSDYLNGNGKAKPNPAPPSPSGSDNGQGCGVQEVQVHELENQETHGPNGSSTGSETTETGASEVTT
ncbi:MAG: hypothetical protein KF751_06755 [Nitrospira sp.]|nr:hypothetical protein [Nitrospira sp.]